MRQDGVGWDRFAAEICQDKPSGRVIVEKPHSVCNLSLAYERRGGNEFEMLRVERRSRDRARQAEEAHAALL